MILTLLEHREYSSAGEFSTVIMGVFTSRALAMAYLIAANEPVGWFAMYNYMLDPPIESLKMPETELDAELQLFLALDLQFYSLDGILLENEPRFLPPEVE